MLLHVKTFVEPTWESLPVPQRYVYKWLYKKIPKRVKRLIFVSSVLGLLDMDKKITNELIMKINALLRVAHNSDAMYFPIAVKSFIWKKIINNPVLDIDGVQYKITDISTIKNIDSHFDSLAKFLLESMPEWLVYGSSSLMEYDIQVLCQKVLA